MLLKEFLEPLGITQSELARHLSWHYARLNELINGKRGITANSALAIGEAFNTGPEFWLNLQGVIMSLASLGFLGYGLPPSIPDWGGMLSREGRKFMEQAPWLALWPGTYLTIVGYSFNMFGDALRDLLDPRL